MNHFGEFRERADHDRRLQARFLRQRLHHHRGSERDPEAYQRAESLLPEPFLGRLNHCAQITYFLRSECGEFSATGPVSPGIENQATEPGRDETLRHRKCVLLDPTPPMMHHHRSR